MNALKAILWNDQIEPSKIVIHQKDVNDAQKGRTSNPLFYRFKTNSNVRILYEGLDNIFKKNVMKIIGTCIVIDNLNNYFKNGIKTDRTLYHQNHFIGGFFVVYY